MNNEGYALVLTMLIIIVLLTLMTGLLAMTICEINLNKFNQDRLEAVYKAEAGIEEAFNYIKHNSIISADDLTNIKGYIENGIYGYEIISAILPEDESNTTGNYIITSRGKASKELYRDITVHIGLTGNGGSTVQAGGAVYLEPENYNGNQHFVTQIDSYVFNTPVEEITQDDFNNYITNKSATEVNGDISLSSNEFNNIADSYDVLYVKGDLSIADNGKNNYIDGGEDGHLIVLVTGKISFNGIRGISNTSFFILGDFEYQQPNAHVNFEDVFIYAGGNIDLSKQSGKGKDQGAGSMTLGPHFNYTGMIIGGYDITIYSKNGQVSKSNDLNIPEEFEQLQKLVLGSPEIVRWIE